MCYLPDKLPDQLLGLLFPSLNGRFVGGWVTESVSVLELYLYEPLFLSVPHRCVSFHRCLLFPILILIRVLFISPRGVDGQYVPSNDVPLEFTGSVLL